MKEILWNLNFKLISHFGGGYEFDNFACCIL